MSTPTTRTFCPLCDWHHDSPDPTLTTPAASLGAEASSLEGLIESHVQQSLTAHYAVLEVIVREHLETHPLIQWVTALTEARQQPVRVRAECDRLEAAVHANPNGPIFDGAYLTPLRHIRRALDGTTEDE